MKLFPLKLLHPRTPPLICTLAHSWTKSFIRLQQNKENKPYYPTAETLGWDKLFVHKSFHFHRVCWVLRGAWGLFLGGGLLFLVFIVVGWLGLWGFFAFFNLKKNSECITIVTELGLLLQQLRILLKLRFTGWIWLNETVYAPEESKPHWVFFLWGNYSRWAQFWGAAEGISSVDLCSKSALPLTPG